MTVFADPQLNYVSRPKDTKKPEKDKTEKKQADKPKAESGGGKKLTLPEVQRDLRTILDGRGATLPSLKSHGAFPWRFCVVKGEVTDNPVILEIYGGNNARVVPPEYVGDKLNEYVEHLSGRAKSYNVDHDFCTKAAKSWARRTTNVVTAMPRIVGFASTSELCIHRHPFDPPTVDDAKLPKVAPIFAEMLTRMSNREAFVLRLGSLFDPQTSRKQALWVYGPKDCGKSQIPTLLMLMVGQQCAMTLDSDDLKDNFAKASTFDKRVVFIMEAPAQFIRSNRFKTWTGERRMSARDVFGKRFMYDNQNIYCAMSNEDPVIPNDDALKVRIIACHMAVVPKGKRINEHELERRMKAELPHVIGYCLGKYLSNPEYRERIPCDDAEVTKAIERDEADYLEFIDHFLERAEPFDSNGKLAEYIVRGHLTELMARAGIRDPQEIKRCKAVLFREFNTKEVRMPPDQSGKRPWVIPGVKVIKTAAPRYPIDIKI